VQFNPAFNVEFTPDPEATLALVRDRYPVGRNLLINSAAIPSTKPVRCPRCWSDALGRLTTVQILQGSHTTPIAQEFGWQPGPSF
jgi:hypothetical protein